MGGKVLVHLPPIALPAPATLGLSDEAARGVYWLWAFMAAFDDQHKRFSGARCSMISNMDKTLSDPSQMATEKDTSHCCKVCILSESDARLFLHAGIGHKCNSRRHHHYAKSKVEALVKSGDLIWLGKHRKLATYRSPRSWAKVYRKNQFGEVISCGMQLTHGGKDF